MCGEFPPNALPERHYLDSGVGMGCSISGGAAVWDTSSVLVVEAMRATLKTLKIPQPGLEHSADKVGEAMFYQTVICLAAIS